MRWQTPNIKQISEEMSKSSSLSMPSVPKLPVLLQAWFAPAPGHGSMGCSAWRVNKHTSLPCCNAHLQWRSYMKQSESLVLSSLLGLTMLEAWCCRLGDYVMYENMQGFWCFFLHILNGRISTLPLALHFCFRGNKFRRAASARFRGVDFLRFF